MSDVPQGPGWWQASDGKWYPPEQFTGAPATPQPPGPTGVPGPPTWTPDAVYQTGYGYGAVPPKNEPLTVASLVLGICSIVLGCCYLGFPLGIAALVTGYLGRKKIDESNGTLTGSGLSLAGMICGGVGVLLGCTQILFVVLGVATSTFSGST